MMTLYTQNDIAEILNQARPEPQSASERAREQWNNTVLKAADYMLQAPDFHRPAFISRCGNLF